MTWPAPPPTLTDVYLAVVRLEGKVDPVVRTTADHEVRLRKLESSRWPQKSIVTLCGIFTVVATVAALWR